MNHGIAIDMVSGDEELKGYLELYMARRIFRVICYMKLQDAFGCLSIRPLVSEVFEDGAHWHRPPS